MTKSIKINGTQDKPRVAVMRSNRFLTAQFIDDTKGVTLLAGTTKLIAKGKPVEKAKELGVEIGKKALSEKITTVVYDRNDFRYHGQIKAFAEGLREAGLKF